MRIFQFRDPTLIEAYVLSSDYDDAIVCCAHDR